MGIFVIIVIIIVINIGSNKRLRYSIMHGGIIGLGIGWGIGKLINLLFAIGEKGVEKCAGTGAVVVIFIFYTFFYKDYWD